MAEDKDKEEVKEGAKEEAQEETSEEPQEKAKAPGKSPKILIFLLLAIVLAGGGFVGFKMLGAKGNAKPELPKVGEIVELEEILVNLADGQTYLKITLALGLKEGETKEEFHEKLPAISDAIIMTLTSKKPEDISTEEGKQSLKAEIRAKVNYVLDPDSHSGETNENPPVADNNADSPENESNPGDDAKQKEERAAGPVLEVYITSFTTQKY